MSGLNIYLNKNKVLELGACDFQHVFVLMLACFNLLLSCLSRKLPPLTDVMTRISTLGTRPVR